MQLTHGAGTVRQAESERSTVSAAESAVAEWRRYWTLLLAAACLGTALGPLAAGVVFDASGSYRQFLYLTVGAMVFSGAVLASLGRPRYATNGQAAAEALGRAVSGKGD